MRSLSGFLLNQKNAPPSIHAAQNMQSTSASGHAAFFFIAQDSQASLESLYRFSRS
jgi:hypothetical protein